MKKETKQEWAPITNRRAQLSEKTGKTEAEIEALWQKYIKSCEGFDQSPLWEEFVHIPALNRS